jgi:hypothetical protein
MTGMVLALAGLTCGDGGQGMGAARASVAASLAGRWEGPATRMTPGRGIMVLPA